MTNTILSQINSTDRFALAAWGAKNFVTDGSGIQFDVRGNGFKGRVVVAVENDTYTLTFGTIRNSEWKVKANLTGIYVENLTMALDGVIN